MTWTVQRQQRAKGGYYSAIFGAPPLPRRCVTLGFLTSSLSTAEMTARLRRFDPSGHLDEATVRRVLVAPTDEAAARAILIQPLSATAPVVTFEHADPNLERGVLTLMAIDLITGDGLFIPAGTHPEITVVGLAEQMGAIGPTPAPRPAAESRPPVAAASPSPVAPPDPRGTMTLDRYFVDVWAPVRRLTGSWTRDQWWWEHRILPVLGEQRICDLDEPGWTRFIASLRVGGRSRAICQNAYRCALNHAVDDLKWIDRLHPFRPVPGATLPSLAEPEPMEQDEVALLLGEAPSTMHRALFGVQIGQGLRPGEVIRLRWECVNWRAKTLFVPGTKNRQATATVAMTPLTVASVRPWWEERGCPTKGPIFLSVDGTRQMVAYPVGALRGAATRAGLNADRRRKVFPYLPRHTFATLAAASGIHSAHTRRMMRHSSTSTVMERAYEKASMGQVSTAFSGFGGGWGDDGSGDDEG